MQHFVKKESMMNEVKAAIRRGYAQTSDIGNGYVRNHDLLCTLEYTGMITAKMHEELRRFNMSLYRKEGK